MVDDKPQNLLVLRGILEGLFANLVSVQSGAEALRWLCEHDAAVILLDVAMPNLDGFETAKLIRLRPRSHKTPIIFVTAVAGDDRQRAAGYQLGAVDYLTKPLEPDAVRSKIVALVTLYQQKQELEHVLTERRRAVEAIHDLNEKLEQRVESRTMQLQAANRELEAFAYSVSHDLRTPLRAIDGFCHILIEEHAEALSEQPRHYLKLISENARQMGRLIDDLLRFSRTGRQALNQETVLAGDLVRQCWEDLQCERLDRQVDFRLGELPDCWADRGLLRQVWLNLLSNAQKFTRRQAAPCIEVGGEISGDDVNYYIRDNGEGFDMQYVDKLFGVFQRLHSDKDFEGTGIGLALAQRIIHRHGGRMWADARPGDGATFFITLPRHPTELLASSSPAPEPAATATTPSGNGST